MLSRIFYLNLKTYRPFLTYLRANHQQFIVDISSLLVNLSNEEMRQDYLPGPYSMQQVLQEKYHFLYQCWE